MRVLTVTNMWPTEAAPQFGIFVRRQVEELRREGLHVDVLFVNGREASANYARGFPRLHRQLHDYEYDVIQANYVFSGVIARSQRRLPVVLTHHGIEVLQSWQAPLCWAVSRLVSAVTVRSREMQRRLGLPQAEVIPAGIDLDVFAPVPREESRARLGLPADRRSVLFVGEPRPEKRLDIARAATDLVARRHGDVDLVTVVGRPPHEVAAYMNAADVLLLPSDNEGSPGVVKEAMACNLPVVATDVGDVREVVGGTDGCHVVAQTPESFAAAIEDVLARGSRTDGRCAVSHLAWPGVTRKLVGVYERVAR